MYDQDEMYAYRLVNFLKNRLGGSYEVMLYTDEKALREFLADKQIDLLLCGDATIWKDTSKWKISKFLKLSEEPEGSEDLGANHSIFKYQSAEHIVREVVGYSTSSVCKESGSAEGKRKGRIILVYSPVGKCYKTSLALAFCESLSRKGEVLYVNLEDYTGLGRYFANATGNIADLMYMYRRGNAEIGNRLQEIVQPIGHFRGIPPVQYPEDVAEVLPEEWSTFVEMIVGITEYQYCVVDMGNLMLKPWEMFRIADLILTPECTDAMGNSKFQEFVAGMESMGRGLELEKIQRIAIEKDETLENQLIDLEKIQWSIVGRLARKIVHDEDI